jgi:hypothetical protein
MSVLRDDSERGLVVVVAAERKFVQSHTFHPADLTIRSDGVCRLNPEMARYKVQLGISPLRV